MGHSLHAAAMIRSHRYYEAIVSHGHELVLNRFFRSPHQIFQRARDVRAEAADLVAHARKFGTGAIVQFTTGQDLVSNTRDQAVQLTWQMCQVRPDYRRDFALSLNRRSSRKRELAKPRQFQNFKRLKPGARNVQACERFSWITQFSKRPDNTALSQLDVFGKGRQRFAQVCQII